MSTALSKSLSDLLRNLGACREARDWAKSYTTLDEAWAVCERADWMLWLAGKLAGPERESTARKRLVLCTCACARTALTHVKAGETRPLYAIETAERWARGEAGVALADVRAAAYDAAAYAAAAYAAYAADAADAAAYAAYAADAAAAYAAAAYAAYAAAYAAAAAAAHSRTLRDLADLVRQHYPTPPESTR